MNAGNSAENVVAAEDLLRRHDENPGGIGADGNVDTAQRAGVTVSVLHRIGLVDPDERPDNVSVRRAAAIRL